LILGFKVKAYCFDGKVKVCRFKFVGLWFDFLFSMKIREAPIVLGRLSNLRLEQHFLNFIPYMKHKNIMKYDTFIWNWSIYVLCDNALFIALCINDVLAYEI